MVIAMRDVFATLAQHCGASPAIGAGMESISNADQRKISVFVRELYSLGSVNVILERVVQSLNTLIAVNSIFVPAFDPRTKIMSVLADDIGPELHKLWPTLVTLRHENPAITHHLSHAAAPAFTMGDLLPRSQWKKTAIFNEFYSKLGMQERLSVSLPFARPNTVALVAHRIRRSFNERDRTVLNLVQFHISEACRTAKKIQVVPASDSIDAIESLVGGSLVALNSSGVVQYCSDLSQRCFETFFPQEKPFHLGLPATVERWVRREIAAFETSDLAIRPPHPLDVRLGERSLHIRLATTIDGTVHILFLRAEDPTLELAKLSALELGARTTEVLYWLAKGKKNEEIGIILGMAPETVKTHLKSIFYCLKVENRATAASMISELLARA
jgi:DNA-binding CsgD family transcriptional regulator